jgi:uncharacterized protein DUF4406
MLKIYISGPMTGVINKNNDSFNRAAFLLRRKGYPVVNPSELDMDQPKSTWAECLRRDIRELMDCDAVATLPSWQKSKGAGLEVYIAKALGCEVHTVKYYLKGAKPCHI